MAYRQLLMQALRRLPRPMVERLILEQIECLSQALVEIRSPSLPLEEEPHGEFGPQHRPGLRAQDRHLVALKVEDEDQ